MQVNHTTWIPLESWPAFRLVLELEGLTHRVVDSYKDGGFHISYVPGRRIDWLIKEGGWREVAQKAIVRFNLCGKEYIYQGRMPKELEKQEREARQRLQDQVYMTELPTFTKMEIPADLVPDPISLILGMGGAVLEVQTIEQDGGIRLWNIPDFNDY